MSRAVQGPLVVVVGPFPPPLTGASIITAAVVERLQEAGASVEVFDTAGGGAGLQYHLRRLVAHSKASARMLWLRLSGKRFSLYIGGAGGLGIWYQLLVVVAGRLSGANVVYHHHSYAYLNAGSRAMRLLCKIGRENVLHIVLCNEMKNLLQRSYAAPRVAVCSNKSFVQPPERDEGSAPERLTDEWVHFGHMSNLTRSKGLATVLEAFQAAAAAGLPVKLHIAGPPADAQAVALLRAAGGGPGGSSVVYHGPLERADLGAYFQRLDWFLFPSTYKNEAEPLVVLEALASGVPVVVLPAGCLGSTLGRSDYAANTQAQFKQIVFDIARDFSLARDKALHRSTSRDVAETQSRMFMSEDESLFEGLLS